jgi:hypothetical protein
MKYETINLGCTVDHGVFRSELSVSGYFQYFDMYLSTYNYYNFNCGNGGNLSKQRNNSEEYCYENVKYKNEVRGYHLLTFT